MALSLSRYVCGLLSRQSPALSLLSGEQRHMVSRAMWFVPAMTLKTTAPLRSEPRKKKKKVDPKRELLIRERLRKKLRKMEKIPNELIPIEDYLTPTKCMEESRIRSMPSLSLEESERRALLLKEWGLYKQEQQLAEQRALELAKEAQKEALTELKLESLELFRAALKVDTDLFPFSRQGPVHTPPKDKYEAPDGKYNDITKVYIQS